MFKLIEQANKAAIVCDAPIIIEGESGTGKQLLAEAVHKMDPKRAGAPSCPLTVPRSPVRWRKALCSVTRRARSPGRRKTGWGISLPPTAGRSCWMRFPNWSTVLQPKLLRVLQEDKVLPVGDDEERHVDVRIIAASNKDLAREVAEGRFRLDLYQRLNVIKLHIPPFANASRIFRSSSSISLKKYKHYYAQTIRSVDPSVYAVLSRAIGQGNIRELENIIRQSLVFKTSGSIFTATDLPDYVRATATKSTPPTISPPTWPTISSDNSPKADWTLTYWWNNSNIRSWTRP